MPLSQDILTILNLTVSDKNERSTPNFDQTEHKFTDCPIQQIEVVSYQLFMFTCVLVKRPSDHQPDSDNSNITH